MRKVIVTREVFKETIDFLLTHFDVTSNQEDRPFNRDELLSIISDAEGVQTSGSDQVND